MNSSDDTTTSLNRNHIDTAAVISFTGTGQSPHLAFSPSARMGYHCGNGFDVTGQALKSNVGHES